MKQYQYQEEYNSFEELLDVLRSDGATKYNIEYTGTCWIYQYNLAK